MSLILSIDQGTTGTTVLAIDGDGRIVGRAYEEIQQFYPKPGWVEHDPEDIWRSVRNTAAGALEAAGAAPGDVRGVGITNQRETVVLWDRSTGEPVHRAIVWQDRRTATRMRELEGAGHAATFRRRTGLVLDPYFSGSKVEWILESAPELRARAEAGELAVGTIDTWVLWKLTAGATHATEPSNASRTLLYRIDELRWDPELLDAFGVPEAILPEVRPSGGVFDVTVGSEIGFEAPVAGILGDQQAALYGQGAWEPGLAKCTYGTGAFLLVNTGDRLVPSERGLLTTVGCGARGQPAYALEGSVFIAGAAIQWLRDELEIVAAAEETEEIAGSLESNEGVYFVPAFVGLGAPHWLADARGLIVGLTRGSGRAHLVRAALESMAYSVNDLISAMSSDAGEAVTELRVDGGAARNDWLMQFQSDIADVPVSRPAVIETTAYGVGALAGLSVGLFGDPEEVRRLIRVERRFEPRMSSGDREALLTGWRRAVHAVRAWTESGEADRH